MKLNSFSSIQDRNSFLFSILVFCFSFGFFLYRTYFGIDFFDEPYYSALTLRLLLGQKLFVDELYLAQTFSVLSYPFFKLHWQLNHSLEGVIIFMRWMVLGLYLTLGLFIYFSLKKFTDRSLALIAAASSCLYFPGNMLTLSYNSLGTLFLVLGLFGLFLAQKKESPGFFFLSGIFMALSSIAYITFCAITALLFLYILILTPKKKLSLFFAAGVAGVMLYPALFIAQHFSDFLSSLAFGKEYLHGTPTLSHMFEVLHKFFPKTVLGFGMLFAGIAHFTSKRSPIIFYWVLCLTPLMAVGLSILSYAMWSVYPFYLSLLSLISFYKIKNSPLAVNLLKWIFIPSWITGLIASGTSASGHINAQVGMVPAAIIALVFLGEALKECRIKFNIPALVSVSLPVFLILFFPLNIWSDSEFKYLTEKIEVGPFRGIKTSKENKLVAERMYRELKPILNTEGPLLVYPNFSSVYLISAIPPARGVTWYQHSGRTNKILAGLYQKQIAPQALVVRMKVGHGAPFNKPTSFFDSKDPLNHLIESTHSPIKDTDWFTVFSPNVVPLSPIPKG